MKSIEQLVDDILNREGPDFTNQPNDKGGPTKYGITLNTYRTFLRVNVPVSQLQALTKEDAAKIYMQMYIVHPGWNQIHNTALVEQLIDAGVQHGVRQAVILLQRALRLHEDGILGSRTVMAANDAQPTLITFTFIAVRLHYYAAILKNTAQWLFAAGWINRMAGLIQAAIEALGFLS
jgi:lysozyme family protein